MKTRVGKWGHSVALHIPKALAAEAGLRENDTVEFSLVAGNLVIQPVAASAPTLEELLRGITAGNLHSEWNTGPAVDEETW